MQIEQLSAAELVKQIGKGELTAAQCTEHFLGQIHDKNDDNGAFLAQCDQEAADAAKQIDASIAAGKSPGPLARRLPEVKCCPSSCRPTMQPSSADWRTPVRL